jgi:FkbM family methyltransferase
MSAPTTDLIFDIGMHRGLDTEFYLRKGFRVVALEARPDFCAEVTDRFAAEVEAGRLVVVQAALWPRLGETITFWINQARDDWGSTHRDWSARAGDPVTEISVPTVTLAELFDRHGVPRYLKCDIEYMDEECARQLLADSRRPDFVSMEASTFDLMMMLRCCGYDRAQLVNQMLHMADPMTLAARAPVPPREGNFVDGWFNGHMSGLFGRDLDPARWITVPEACERWVDFFRLQNRDPCLASGWLDIHVTRHASIADLGVG